MCFLTCFPFLNPLMGTFNTSVFEKMAAWETQETFKPFCIPFARFSLVWGHSPLLSSHRSVNPSRSFDPHLYYEIWCKRNRNVSSFFLVLESVVSHWVFHTVETSIFIILQSKLFNNVPLLGALSINIFFAFRQEPIFTLLLLVIVTAPYPLLCGYYRLRTNYTRFWRISPKYQVKIGFRLYCTYS
jgi:hypothetical protein